MHGVRRDLVEAVEEGGARLLEAMAALGTHGGEQEGGGASRRGRSEAWASGLSSCA